jgi:hypothetical protein
MTTTWRVCTMTLMVPRAGPDHTILPGLPYHTILPGLGLPHHTILGLPHQTTKNDHIQSDSSTRPCWLHPRLVAARVHESLSGWMAMPHFINGNACSKDWLVTQRSFCVSNSDRGRLSECCDIFQLIIAYTVFLHRRLFSKRN